jgi:hypothetical protein
MCTFCDIFAQKTRRQTDFCAKRALFCRFLRKNVRKKISSAQKIIVELPDL